MSTNETEKEMRCTVCRRQRHSLTLRPSALKEDLPLFLCTECLAAKREPRYLVILIARRDGMAAVSDYIRKYRYFGDKITADELLSYK